MKFEMKQRRGTDELGRIAELGKIAIGEKKCSGSDLTYFERCIITDPVNSFRAKFNCFI